MEWTGEALVIGVRRHGESSVILEVMAAGQGRHMGLVRGGRSPRKASVLQAGNTVQVTWRARLAEHLGSFSVELLDARAADLIADRTRLYAAQLICDHLRLLPERDPHDHLLAMAVELMENDVDLPALGTKLARFELRLLDELGFGLDLSSCAVSGATQGLTHVSPKTGRAVTTDAAGTYIDKLLKLPPFLITQADPGPGELQSAFRLTGHFLAMHVWSARNISPPTTRERVMELLAMPL